MSRPIEDPVTMVDEHQHAHQRTTTTHPAFGQIVASRVSGRANLYGSDFTHNGYITISISRSQLNRDLNRDWHYGSDQLVEVALTEAQWATFVSSMNVGSGVPCTLQRLPDDWNVPGLPDPKNRVDQFTSEMEASLQKSLDMVDAMIADAKTKAQKQELGLLRQQLVKNLPFVARQFGEHVEHTVEKGKAEIHGYMVSVIQRAGLEALTNSELPLQIEHTEKTQP